MHEARRDWTVIMHAHSAERKGYSGTAILCRESPSGSTGIGQEEHDAEGRVIAPRSRTTSW